MGELAMFESNSVRDDAAPARDGRPHPVYSQLCPIIYKFERDATPSMFLLGVKKPSPRQSPIQSTLIIHSRCCSFRLRLLRFPDTCTYLPIN